MISCFQLINTFEKSYDDIITLIRIGKNLLSFFENLIVLICKTLNLLDPRMLCAKFC